MKLRRCELCRYALNEPDHVVCALIPPTPLGAVDTVKDEKGEDKPVFAIRWVRPAMKLTAFCGQFRLSIWKLLGGART